MKDKKTNEKGTSLSANWY